MSPQPRSGLSRPIRSVSCGACDMSELCELTEKLRRMPRVHRAVLRTLHRDESVKRQQSPDTALFAVRKGLLKVVRTERDGRRRSCGLYAAGDLIPANLLKSDSSADVVAVTDAMICELDTQTIASLCDAVPTTRDTVDWLLKHNKASKRPVNSRSTTRLDRFLKTVSNRLRARGLSDIDLLALLTQQDLADILQVNRGAIGSAIKARRRNHMHETGAAR